MSKLKAVFGDPVDEGALRQIETCLEDERAMAGALMADHHLGYSMPIGGVVAYRDAISPSGVGFDIACGNKAVRTAIQTEGQWTPDFVKPLMRQVQKTVSFGLGRSNPEPIDHALFDSPVWDELDTAPGQPLKQKAAQQLGTVGSGNHYVDLLTDEEGFLWIANHFGSRGFGHTVASWFLAVAAGGKLGDRVPETETPAVLDIGTAGGDLYVEAMRLAGEYAYAGRDYVIEQVLGLVGNPAVTFEVHNHHNFAWQEDGLWVVRKGATPLTHEHAFIGGSMGDVSVIVRGLPAVDAITAVSSPGPLTEEERLLYPIENIGAINSAPHGAGRTMSRTAAAGKLRKMWVCGNRNCSYPGERSMGNKPPTAGGKCPVCDLPLRKLRVRDKSTAAVDWDAVRAALSERGIVVLGSGADEAPEVYKDLQTVIGQHPNIEVLHTLKPIGVVMAGSDVRDPYAD